MKAFLYLGFVISVIVGLFSGAALSQAPFQWPPPVQGVLWSPNNPDMLGIISKDPSAGATGVAFREPLPRGNAMVLRIASAGAGQQDLSYFVQANDNVNSVAAAFCNLILQNNVLKSRNISCQLQGSVVGVTNFTTELAYVAALNWPQNMVVSQGSPAWDAGPILFLNRQPPGGVPPPGSSVGQIMFNGPSSISPGLVDTQYVMLQGKVNSSNYQATAGQLEVYTTNTIANFQSPTLRVIIYRGIQLCDVNQNCPPDVGAGTINIPRSDPDGMGPGLFIGTRKVCIAPPGSYAAGYLYLAEGAACPPGG